MSKLIQEIETFKQKAKAHLQNKKKTALMQIVQKYKDYENFISSSDIAAAIIDLEKLTDLKEPKNTPKHTTIPPLLRFGHLIADTKDGNGKPIKIPVPLILPYTENNAVLVDIENAKPDMIPALFQTIALRYLLTMKMKLCKFYFIDTDFGNSFPLFKNFENKQLREMINEPEEVDKLISYLEKTVSQANFGMHQSLTAYNAHSELMAKSYHFVFIDDFPRAFSSSALEGLLRLIDNKNAIRTGIHIFINYSRKNITPQTPYDFDINRFKKICGFIYAGENNDVSLHNWNKINAFPKYKIEIETKLPQNASEIIKFVNNIKEEEITLSLDEWIDDLKNDGKVWKETTMDGINVPIGFKSPTEKFHFYMANDNDKNCNDFFALIAGFPGYGKTVFLDNIIVNSCFKYPPDELQLFLADFKNGISFKKYRNLPHVKTLMLADNKEYALRILKYLIEEAKRRSKDFDKAEKECGEDEVVDKLAAYRRVTGKKMPRILLIMDEFQNLFQSHDMVTIEARNTLIKGVREWRALGISIILCTQDLTGVDFGEANTMITYRFALSLPEMESKKVIGNGAAQMLTNKGQAIMNNAKGDENKNEHFQGAYTSRYKEHVNWLAEYWKQEKGELPAKYVCETGTDANIVDNTTLWLQIENDKFTVNHNFCDTFVGKPDLLRDKHTCIRYRRQENSNTLIFGDDYKTAINTIAVSLIQIQKQSAESSRYYIVDCFDAGNKYHGSLNGLIDYSQEFHLFDAETIADCIANIEEELDNRKKANAQKQTTNERIVLAILNIQSCDELRAQKNEWGGTDPSATTTKLVKILDEGSTKGIHCIIHSVNYHSLEERIFSTDTMRKFENKIFLEGIDVEKTLIQLGVSGIEIPNVDKSGQMIVLNAKMDDEDYEQCNGYSKITATNANEMTEFISKLFNSNQDD